MKIVGILASNFEQTMAGRLSGVSYLLHGREGNALGIATRSLLGQGWSVSGIHQKVLSR